MVARDLVRLTDLPAGASGTVARIDVQEAPVLQYLASLGLNLGAKVVVDEIAPYGGVRMLRIGSDREATTHPMGEDPVKHVLVTPATQEEPGAV
jgi:Fe2+ transport system protein FeoA